MTLNRSGNAQPVRLAVSNLTYYAVAACVRFSGFLIFLFVCLCPDWNTLRKIFLVLPTLVKSKETQQTSCNIPFILLSPYLCFKPILMSSFLPIILQTLYIVVYFPAFYPSWDRVWWLWANWQLLTQFFFFFFKWVYSYLCWLNGLLGTTSFSVLSRSPSVASLHKMTHVFVCLCLVCQILFCKSS